MAHHTYNAFGAFPNLLKPQRSPKTFFDLPPVLNSGSTEGIAELHKPIVSKVKSQIDPSESAVFPPLVVELWEDAPTSLLGNL